MYFALIDLENEDLSLTELETYSKILKKERNFCILDKKLDYNYLAYTKYYGELLYELKSADELFDLDLFKNKRKLALFIYSVGGKKSKKELENIIFENFKENLDYKKGEKILIFLSKDKIFLGKIEWERERFSKRDPKNRPFNRPFTLKPKFARALVNISNESLIVDPFVGTGTILIEAFLTERDYFGLERDWKVIKGCYKNLEYFGMEKKVVLSDALYFDKIFKKLKNFGVVSDLPYGKSSSLFGRSVISLYEEFIEKLMKTKVKNAVLVFRKGEETSYLEEKYKSIIRKKIDFFVNSNLTRRILIFQFDS